MDAAGVDVPILSYATPSAERLEPSLARGLTKQANDELGTVVSKRAGTRYAGLFQQSPRPLPPKDALWSTDMNPMGVHSPLGRSDEKATGSQSMRLGLQLVKDHPKHSESFRHSARGR
jgi:hypothetical protein